MGNIWPRIRKIFKQPNFSNGGICKWIFPFFQKCCLGNHKHRKENNVALCLSALQDCSSNFKFIDLGWFFFFGYYGFLLLRLLFCLFLFNNCTGAFDDKSWPLSQSDPELQSTCGSEIRAEQGKVELAQETCVLALLWVDAMLNYPPFT